MTKINEATDTDLKVIEELKKLGWKPGDTLRCNEGNSIALINKLLDDIDTCKPKSNFIEFLDIDKALPEIIEANSSLCIDEKNMLGGD